MPDVQDQEIVDAASPMGLKAARADLALALLAMLFLVLPLYRSPILEDSFLSPKLLMLQVAVAAVLLARVWSRRGTHTVHGQDARATAELFAYAKPGGADTPVHPGRTRGIAATVLLAAFVLVHVPSLVHAPSMAMAVTALVYFTSFLLLHLVCRMVVRGSTAIGLLFNCGLIAAIGTAAWTLYEDAMRGGAGNIVARLPDWRGYLSAGLGNSGHIAGYMGLFLPWGLAAFLTAPRFRPFLFVGLLIMAGGFVVTWSVGSAGATLLSLGLWGLVIAISRFRRLVRWIRTIPLIIGTCLVAAFYLLPHPANPHQPSLWKEAFGSERWAEGWPTRIVIWKTTWHMIAENPIIGIGAGNFTREYVQQVVPSVLSDPKLRVYAGAFTNDAHNEYLQVWCEGGIAALVLFVAIFGVWMVSTHRAARRLEQEPADAAGAEHYFILVAAAAGITVFLLDSLMTFPIRLPAHFAALMLFLAAPACLATRAASATAPARSFNWRAAAMLLPALACLVIHFRRVAAEYYLKEARTVVENSLVFYRGQPMGAWQAADYALSAGIHQLAQGNRASAEVLFNSAQEFTKTEAFHMAAQAFRQAYEWDSNYTNSTSRYAQLKLMERSYDTARALLLATLEHLQAGEVLERLGFAEYMLGNKDAAVKAWQTALERRPMQAPHYQGLIRQAQQ